MLNIEKDIRDEIKRAEGKFKHFNSSHEGYAIIKEELDELWDEVKNNKNHTERKQYTEAIHVACTAIRFCKMIRDNYDGILPNDRR